MNIPDVLLKYGTFGSAACRASAKPCKSFRSVKYKTEINGIGWISNDVLAPCHRMKVSYVLEYETGNRGLNQIWLTFGWLGSQKKRREVGGKCRLVSLKVTERLTAEETSTALVYFGEEVATNIAIVCNLFIFSLGPGYHLSFDHKQAPSKATASWWSDTDPFFLFSDFYLLLIHLKATMFSVLSTLPRTSKRWSEPITLLSVKCRPIFRD